MAEELRLFFENAVLSLNISRRSLTLGNATNLSDPVEITIRKFENHPRVQIIKEHRFVDQEFDF